MSLENPSIHVEIGDNGGEGKELEGFIETFSLFGSLMMRMKDFQVSTNLPYPSKSSLFYNFMFLQIREDIEGSWKVN